MPSVSKRKWTHNGEEKEAWSVRYLDPQGVKRRKTFARKKDADRFSFKVSNDIENGVLIPDSEARTMLSVCDEFLRHSEDRKRHGLIGWNRYNSLTIHINKSITPRLGKMKLPKITGKDIEDWFAALTKVDGLHVTTARDRLSTLRMVESFAIRRKYVASRFTEDAAAGLKGIKRTKIRTFTVTQVGTLLDASRVRSAYKHRSSALLNCFINIAAFCGLRLGEIKALTLPNVDVEQRIIQVRHNLLTCDVLKGPKTEAGVRDVPIPHHVAILLKEWIDRYYIENDRGLIFRTGGGGMIDNSNINEMWLALLVRAGIADGKGNYHFHALRHFAASWMIQNGLSGPDIAGLLGHEKYDLTLQVYAHSVIGTKARQAALDRMSNALLGLEKPLEDPSKTHVTINH